MVCSPRTTDGRCHPAKAVYQLGKKRVEIPIGKTVEERIPGPQLLKALQNVDKEALALFPDEIRLSMGPDRVRVSDTREGKEEVWFEFSIDPLGLKMVKEYDELPVWIALYRGLNKDEIDLNTFYEGLARTGAFKRPHKP